MLERTATGFALTLAFASLASCRSRLERQQHDDRTDTPASPTARPMTGRALDENGASLARESVWLLDAQRTVIASSTSAPDGSFDLGPRPPGRYFVSVSSTDHVEHVQWVDVGPTAIAEPLTVRLRRCVVSISGTVRDQPTAAPLPSARVAWGEGLGTLTTGDGRYRLCLPGAPERVSVSADGHREESVTIAESTPNRGDVDFALARTAIVIGLAPADAGADAARGGAR